METVDPDVTRILNAAGAGDRQAAQDLTPLVYGVRRTGWVEDAIAAPSDHHDEIPAVHEVLDCLAAIEPRKAGVVKLRYFISMTNEETAEVLGISAPTAKRDWTCAKAWLFRELGDDSAMKPFEP